MRKRLKMGQRNSGYERVEHDFYQTPPWATRALLPHIPPRIGYVWEPAAGEGRMVRELAAHGLTVTSSDIQMGEDFLRNNSCFGYDAIITNPPYKTATAFIEHALSLTKRTKGFVAMLLRTDFDHAKGRRNLFAENPAFAKKLVLTKRIQWFEDAKASPSENHAWFIFDWRHEGPPTISYHFEEPHDQ